MPVRLNINNRKKNSRLKVCIEGSHWIRRVPTTHNRVSLSLSLSRSLSHTQTLFFSSLHKFNTFTFPKSDCVQHEQRPQFNKCVQLFVYLLFDVYSKSIGVDKNLGIIPEH